MPIFVNTKNVSVEEGVKAYSEQADKWDEYARTSKATGSSKAAELLSELIPDKANVKVMDLACGTGLAGESLKAHGFCHIDCVDGAQGMLDICKSKNVYDKLILAFIENHGSLPVSDDEYDAVIMVDGMGSNMVPIESLDEMIRLVKPGGYILNLLREIVLKTSEQYKDKLEPHMDCLEQQGKWRRISRERHPEYMEEFPGIVYVYQKC